LYDFGWAPRAEGADVGSQVSAQNLKFSTTSLVSSSYIVKASLVQSGNWRLFFSEPEGISTRHTPDFLRSKCFLQVLQANIELMATYQKFSNSIFLFVIAKPNYFLLFPRSSSPSSFSEDPGFHAIT
jgi:hypothetical protein